jgi:hypothetical protein
MKHSQELTGRTEVDMLSQIIGCIICNKPLSSAAKELYKYVCSKPCKDVYDKTKNTSRGTEPNISMTNKGALGEYAVSADLIRRGFKVFKALTPGGPFDLIIALGENLLRVEVKTGRKNIKTGTLYYGNTERNEYDILAIYDLGTGDIFYRFETFAINDFKP